MDSEPLQPPQLSPAGFKLPGEMPVMVLSNCYLFPGCCLPLFIFEERYRLMLAHALKTDRMFCIGVRADEFGDEHDILPVSTAGLIRLCVRNDDGTSHLMLHGLSRVEIIGWAQEKPFRIARIEPRTSIIGDERRVQKLRSQALELIPEPEHDACDALKLLREILSRMEDSETVCDVLAYHFVRRPSALHSLLVERSIDKRYDILLAEMRRTAAE